MIKLHLVAVASVGPLCVLNLRKARLDWTFLTIRITESLKSFRKVWGAAEIREPNDGGNNNNAYWDSQRGKRYSGKPVKQG
jgi:hypothetical protein